MPVERFIHPKLGHSEKVTHLTDLEYRVWTQFILSADDFGVMRLSAVTVQAANDALQTRPQKQIQRCLEVLVKVGLILPYEHQGHRYCCQWDWQTWQSVKHPRQTIAPKPPIDVLAQCDRKTQALFTYWPGKKKEKIPEDFGNVSGPVSDLARAGACETAHANANGSRVEGEAGEPTLPARAGAFADWYAETHERLLRIAYIGNPRKDYEAGLQLCDKLTDAELHDAALVWFGMDDDFATAGTRTITKFASRASWCLQQAKTRAFA